MRKAPGRPPRLTEQQLEELRIALLTPPAYFGLKAQCWTSVLVTKAIKAWFGVKYDPDHVGRLIHKLAAR